MALTRSAALHILMLCDGIDAELRIIPRSLNGRVNPSYDIIAAGKGFHQRILPIPLEAVLSPKQKQHFRILDIAAAADVVDG